MLLVGGPKHSVERRRFDDDYRMRLPVQLAADLLDEPTNRGAEERKLEHGSGGAEKFYRGLPEAALIGMESPGNCQWFVEMATTAGHQVLIGDAAKIRASEVRQQKHDRRNAALILRLLLKSRLSADLDAVGRREGSAAAFDPPAQAGADRVQVKNELQHLAMNPGVTKKGKLWSKAGEQVLRELPLKPRASRRRADLLILAEDVGWADWSAG